MDVNNTPQGYGLISRLFHWLMAIAIFAMFGIGLWMMGLDYYSPYYHSGREFHKGAGILLLIALALRFVWRLVSVKPDDEELSPLERIAARVTHWSFYPLLLTLMVSGYLISTADGRVIDVFGWFSVPSPGENKGLEDTAGAIHKYLAYFVILFAALHASAALKHHIVDRNHTLKRMWSGPSKS